MKKIFLTGVSCVGKTTIGKELANLLGCAFFDLDTEVEKFYRKPLAKLQSECLTMYTYRQKAAAVLRDLLKREAGLNCVVALPPSGLRDCFSRVVTAARGIVVVLEDAPENILARLVFYDDNSRRLEKVLTEAEKPLYLTEIRKDINYFRRFYRRADLHVDISGLEVRVSSLKIMEAIEQFQRTAHQFV